MRVRRVHVCGRAECQQPGRDCGIGGRVCRHDDLIHRSLRVLCSAHHRMDPDSLHGAVHPRPWYGAAPDLRRSGAHVVKKVKAFIVTVTMA